MSYANNDHYKWVESVTKKPVSPLGREVANVLGYVGRGIYNAPLDVTKTDWTDTYYIGVAWSQSMANWDFRQLTELVIECHRRMLRVSIKPNMKTLKLEFWQRSTRDHAEGTSKRLPDIEEMIAMQDAEWGRLTASSETPRPSVPASAGTSAGTSTAGASPS